MRSPTGRSRSALRWLPTTIRRIDVAFICTGNICRSPMAEVLLRERLAALAPEIVVGSAGLLFDDGRPAETNAIKAMQRRGLDLSAHRARTISLEVLGPTSLILAMEPMHVRQVAVLAIELYPRSFTLPEFTQAASLFGPRPSGESLRSWVERIAAPRSPGDHGFENPQSSIADPMGKSRRAFRACADEIDDLLAELVDLAWPVPEHRDPPVATTTPGGTHADRDRR